jgi:hypothetical protein
MLEFTANITPITMTFSRLAATMVHVQVWLGASACINTARVAARTATTAAAIARTFKNY